MKNMNWPVYVAQCGEEQKCTQGLVEKRTGKRPLRRPRRRWRIILKEILTK